MPEEDTQSEWMNQPRTQQQILAFNILHMYGGYKCDLFVVVSIFYLEGTSMFSF